MKKLLFTVIDAFDVKDKGVTITGFPDTDYSIPDNECVVILSIPEREDLEVTIKSHELLRNCFSPEKPRALSLLISGDISSEDLKSDSKRFKLTFSFIQ